MLISPQSLERLVHAQNLENHSDRSSIMDFQLIVSDRINHILDRRESAKLDHKNKMILTLKREL